MIVIEGETLVSLQTLCYQKLIEQCKEIPSIATIIHMQSLHQNMHMKPKETIYLSDI